MSLKPINVTWTQLDEIVLDATSSSNATEELIDNASKIMEDRIKGYTDMDECFSYFNNDYKPIHYTLNPQSLLE